MKKLFLLYVCFYTNTILSAGFIAGTLINTPVGLIPIEQVKAGDSVFALGVDGCYYTKPVAFVSKKQESQLIKLIIDGEVILTTPEQCFLKGPEQIWTPGANLQSGDKVLACSGYLTIRTIESFCELVDVYRLCIIDLGNFYVSKHEILVQDFNFLRGRIFPPKKPIGYVLLEKSGEYAVYGGGVVLGVYLLL